MYKYLILDFGKVIAGPTTGDWFMTPKFLELIDVNKLNIYKFNRAKKKHEYLLSSKLLTQEEEYEMFINFYDGILRDSYPDYNMNLAKKIAYDFTYKFSKYTLYEDIYKELDILKEKYILIMLTDNWPCVDPYLKHYKLDKYFDKIYISSIYGCQKDQGTFFDYPIKDYNIKKGEALFIDDSKKNLDEASLRDLDVLLMDRKKEIKTSKYKVINNLFDL